MSTIEFELAMETVRCITLIVVVFALLRRPR